MKTQCWVITAIETGDNAPGTGECPQFRWVFSQREDAQHTYSLGREVLPHLLWNIMVTPFDDVEHALHDINYLKDFEAAKEEV